MCMCHPASGRGENSSHSSRTEHHHRRHHHFLSCLSRRLRGRGGRCRLCRRRRPHQHRVCGRLLSLLRFIYLLRVQRRALLYGEIGTATRTNDTAAAAVAVTSGVFLVASRGEGRSTRENSASTTPSTIEVSLVGRASTPDRRSSIIRKAWEQERGTGETEKKDRDANGARWEVDKAEGPWT